MHCVVIEGDDEFTWGLCHPRRFKIIPVLTHGSFILKKTLGSRMAQKPVLPGLKVRWAWSPRPSLAVQPCVLTGLQWVVYVIEAWLAVT
jgi:hypothetical protein